LAKPHATFDRGRDVQPQAGRPYRRGVEAYAEDNAAFRQALSREKERVEDGEDMGFFVKNVENVQGDERDVIIFSSTFGPNAQRHSAEALAFSSDGR